MEESEPNNVIKGDILSGYFAREDVKVLDIKKLGDTYSITAIGQRSGNTIRFMLPIDSLHKIDIHRDTTIIDGQAARARLGIEALRLGLAYEYDPYFSLSVARVDPLPHQLEAVYEYFLELPRIRFLLADDPGAGKTIMAGLLIKELKARGLAERILIVAPANLTFQWQRELFDRFREDFDVINGAVLRTNYGQNPWQEKKQAITSVAWVSRVEDARESLLRAHWDLVIVDEAHKMSASSPDKPTLAYSLGSQLSKLTDHYLLMTATPHKGDKKAFRLFLSLLDEDVYAGMESVREALQQKDAPFYLRRTKEALVTFPDPETGECRKLFTKRVVKTLTFDLSNRELAFYDLLSQFVRAQSIQAAEKDNARNRAIGFNMAMLQRRMASTIYAVRRSLERMKEKRAKILEDPKAWRAKEKERRMPDDFDELPEDEQSDILRHLEEVVASFDPFILKVEIEELARLVEHAKILEHRGEETKLSTLKTFLEQQKFFTDPTKKLLIFTEHKDSLDFLVGDGQSGRPLGVLRQWGLEVTQIHGGMKIGDRDMVGTRIWAEDQFRKNAQIMVATEAAGEGINLQFCSWMINYDIPWNPVRLEQRVGRIHRYGQKRTCNIYNFVTSSTIEGRVLRKLLDRLEQIREDLETDQVFDVVGEIVGGNMLERLLRDLYAGRITEDAIKDRIEKNVDKEHFKAIIDSALEGLARRDLNLSMVLDQQAIARERRLVPEATRNFFLQAAQQLGLKITETARRKGVYRVGKLNHSLRHMGNENERKYGRLAKSYDKIIFDKELLDKDPTLEWVTPGHPLFEVVRMKTYEDSMITLTKGAVFTDIQREKPVLLDLFDVTLRDGLQNILHRRLFVVECTPEGEMSAREPSIFFDLCAAGPDQFRQDLADYNFSDVETSELFLYQHELQSWVAEKNQQREKEINRIQSHLILSLDELIHHEQRTYGKLHEKIEKGDQTPGLEGLKKQSEERMLDLNVRKKKRCLDLELEKNCLINEFEHRGRFLVLPHPQRNSPDMAPMVSDKKIEEIAVRVAWQQAESEGWTIEDVQSKNCGYDLLARRQDPQNQARKEIRYIEVKGRAAVGQVFLSPNEYQIAQRMGTYYWLYVVFDCAGEPHLHRIQDPACLPADKIKMVEYYSFQPDTLKGAES